MALRRGTIPFHFAADYEDGVRPGTWQFSADAVVVRIKPDAAPPAPGEFSLTYPQAEAREDVLWRSRAADGDDKSFVRRSAQVDDETRRGVYLPVPSTAGWDVAIPAGAVLRMQVGILPPEVADGTRSDGADVDVRVDGAVVQTVRARVGSFPDVRVPLAKWGGRTVRVALSSHDGTPLRDHVFVGSPTIYVPSDAPKRTLLVFIDTLRRDHLATYGYGRGASPAIDAWAKGAVVFDDARSVAPWTLPSARALLSGNQPEFWDAERSLPARLGAAGWATGAYVGNVYLSSNFEMSGGWDEHGCINWPYARVEVDRGLDFLERHADQDALLMVHFMDMHLPYKEPPGFRNLYEKDRPAGLPEGFTRFALLNAARGNRERVKKYLLARYDQNLRYIDAEVTRLLAAAGPDANVVIFADHGEEFFDHGDLEHGHTLYDELLRVPFALAAPGLHARRVTAPVSLLDLTPTVLDLLGLPDPSLQGHSLLPAAKGEPDPALDGRAIAFGRPLYGNEAWGSVSAGRKYISRSGKEQIFDLTADAEELSNLRADGADPAPGRAAMATALDRPTEIAYRLAPQGRGSGPFTVEFHVAGGIADAWVGDDPTMKSSATITRTDDETITATFESVRGAHREVFVVPRLDPVENASNVTARIDRPGLAPVALTARPLDGFGESLAHLTAMGRTLDVTYAVLPKVAGNVTPGADAELNSALQKMGYLDNDGERSEDGGAAQSEDTP
jgi:arylsulfatase A-like enzyme